MPDPETTHRLQLLEQHCLQLEACSLFQAQATAVQFALIQRLSEPSSHPQIHRWYRETLRQNTEDYLRTLADDRPALASALRAILARELDASLPPSPST